MQDATTSAYPNSAAPRIAWIDVMRGYSMILIVLGHSLLGLLSANALSRSENARSLVLFIYLFHMPAIFFVSGLVSKDQNKDAKAFFISQFKWIVAPYFVWSIVLIVAQNLSPSAVNNPIGLSAIPALIWLPVSVFWFLYVFFWAKVTDYVVFRIWKGPNTALFMVMITGVLGWVAYGYTDNSSDLARQYLCCLFFYEVGHYVSVHPDWLNRLFIYVERKPIAGFWMAIFGFFILATISDFYMCMPTADINPISEFQRYILLTGLIGLVPVILLSWFSAKFPLSVPVKLAGVYSMVIYVQHTLWGAAARGGLIKLHIKSDPVYIIAVTGAGLVLPVLWQAVTDRLRITPYFGIRPIKN